MNTRAYGFLCLLSLLASGPLGCSVDRNSQVASAGVAQWSLQPNTLVADGHSAASYQLTAYRATGEVYKGAQVAVDASDAHVLVEEPPLSDPLGTTSATVRCTQAGTFTLTARVYEGELWYPLAGIASLTCVQQTTAAPQQAPNLTLTALYDIAATGVGTPLPLTLQVTDAQGQPLVDQWVTLTTPRAGDQVAPATARTDAQGRVQVALTATSLGAATVVAQAGAATASVTVQFVADAPDLTTSTFAARPGSVPADGHESRLLDLTMRDGAGRPVPYVPVTFASDQAADVLSPAAALTDWSGHLSVALIGTRAGSRTITASLYNGPLTAQTALEPGPPDVAHSQLMLTPTLIADDGVSSSAIAVLLADAYGNVISNTNVMLSSSVMTDVIDPMVGTTLADGTMAASIAGTWAGARLVTAQSGGITLTAPLTMLADVPSSGLSTLTVAPPAPTAGIPCTVTLLLLDGQHNPIAGQAVAFASSVPGDGLTASLPAVTGADGRLTGTFLATQAGARTLTATVAGLSLTAPLTVWAGPASAVTSALDPSPSVQVADDVSVITLAATFQDAFNNPIVGSPVTWSGGGAQDAFSTPTSNTDSLGAAVSTLRSTLAHALPVYAQLGNLTLGANVTFVAGPPSQAQSSLQVNPNSVVADGASISTLTAIINDAFGNPVAASTVTFVSSGISNDLASTSAATSSSGLASTTLASTKAETKTVTASAAGISLSGNVIFMAGSPNLAMSSLSIVPPTRVADGNQAICATAQINDVYGNPVAGLTASVTVSGTNTSATSPSGLTSTSGSFVSQITTTTVQNQNITLAAGPYSLTSNVNFTLGPPSPLTSTFVANPSSGLASNGNAVSTLSLVVRDSLSRVLPGIAVTYATPGRQGTLGPGTATTSISGQSSATLSNVYAGTVPVFASMGNVVLATSASFTSQPGYCSTKVMMGGRPDVYGLNGIPVQVVAADLNHDGLIDMASLNQGSSNQLQLYLGQGNATFGGLQSFTVSASPKNMTVVDLNNDHFPEIVIANNTNQLTTYKGSATASYAPYTTTSLAGNVTSTCSGDINNDGKQDIIALVTSGTYGACILLGDGAAGYQTPVCTTLSSKPASCVTADFDLDGWLDVAIGYSANSNIDILSGNGTSAPSLPRSYATSYVANTILKTGNINEDAYPDIAGINAGSNTQIKILLSQAGGNLAGKYVSGLNRMPYSLDLADMDGDGHTDIVTLSDGNFAIMYGAGNGNFSSPTYLATGVTVAPGTVADLDGDGHPDLVGTSNAWSNFLFTIYNDGSNNYPKKYNLDFFTRFFFILADVNNDGFPDVVAPGSSASIYINQKNGSFNPAGATIAGPATSSITAGDFNGDGNLDLAAPASGSASLQVLLGQGDGNFVPRPVPYPSTATAFTGWVKSADINQDGLADIVYSDGNSIRTFLGAPNGNIVIGAYFFVPAGLTCSHVDLGDLDNDGLMDVMAVCNYPVVWHGTGAGQFGPSETYPTMPTFNDVALVDMNEDGYVDAVLGGGSSRVAVYLNQRNGTISTSPSGQKSIYNRAIAVGDFDGDAHVDIVTQSTIYFGDGVGGLPRSLSYPGISSNQIQAADINGDGRMDFVIQTYENYLVSYINSGCTPY